VIPFGLDEGNPVEDIEHEHGDDLEELPPMQREHSGPSVDEVEYAYG
jgi:hypothetical protein